MASVARLDRTGVGPSGRPRSASRADLVTILLGTWAVLGLVADGNTHVNTPQLETFFTPAHALLYSGYMGAAGWMGWQVLQRRRQGRHALDAGRAGTSPEGKPDADATPPARTPPTDFEQRRLLPW